MNPATVKILKVLLIVAVVSYGAWIFIGLIQNQRSVAQHTNEAYTPSDLAEYKQHCKQTLSIKNRYPEITEAYCNCYVEAVTNKYTKRQLEEIGLKSARERDSILNDIIRSCAKATGRDSVR